MGLILQLKLDIESWFEGKKQEMAYPLLDARLRVPLSLLVTGPSSSGKSTFTLNLLKHSHRLIERPFDYVWYFYGEKSVQVQELESGKYGQNIQVHEGIPENIKDFIKDGQWGLFIFDDLTEETSKDPQISSLFYRTGHHRRVSLILISQNIYHEGKERKNILRNCRSLCIFSNPLDQSLIWAIAGKVMPRDQKTFFDIFERATDSSHGYLFIDGHQSTPKSARFRTQIFNEVQRVFVPTKWLSNTTD